MPRPILLITVLCLLALTAWQAPAHMLTINVLDATTGEHLAFRGSVTDAGATERWPLPASTCYMHTATAVWREWWIAESPCTLSIPAGGEGIVIVRAGHGFEYRPDTTSVTVTADASVAIWLTPLTDMGALGWWSGDPEADLVHGPVAYTCDESDGLFNCKAEDLNVFNAEGGTITGTPSVDGDYVCYTTYELRNQRLGHLCPLGAVAAPDSVVWATNLAPTLHAITTLMADAGPSPKLVVLQNHPSEWGDTFRETDFTTTPGGGMWPREAIVDAYYGSIDAYDMMFLSDGYTADRYHHILSSGIRLTATGGTDSALSAVDKGPTGSVRTYAYTTDFSYWNWIAAIDAGRTFATNGPLFTAWTVDGEMPGGEITFDNLHAQTLPIVVAFDSAYPVKRLDYLVNGSRVGGRVFTTAKTSWDTTDASGVSVEHGGAWVSGRLVGDDAGWFTCAKDTPAMVAETSPVYVTMAGLDANVTGDAIGPDYCADWCDSLISVTKWMHGRATATWATGADSATALSLYRDARTGYKALARQTTYTVGAGGDYATLVLALHATTGCDPFDTLILLDGSHVGGGTTLPVPNGVTIRSLGPDHRDLCTVWNPNATAPGVHVDSLAYLLDFTMRTNADITADNQAALTVVGAAADARLDYVRFANTNSTARQSAIYADACERLWLKNCEIDSCHATGAGVDYGAMWLHDVNNLVIQDSRFLRCSSPDRAPFFVYNGTAQDSTYILTSLFYGNASANYGALRLYSGAEANSPHVDHCTFVDNTCTDTGDGVVNFDGAQTGYLDHTIITGGNGNAISVTYQPDYARWSNAWDNDGTEWLYAGTDSVDCIEVDPEYTTTDLTSSVAYMAMSVEPASGTSNPRETADGSYMGWLDPPAVPLAGSSGLRGGHSRFRRFRGN